MSGGRERRIEHLRNIGPVTAGRLAVLGVHMAADLDALAGRGDSDGGRASTPLCFPGRRQTA